MSLKSLFAGKSAFPGKAALSAAAIATIAATLAIGAATPVQAQYCEGTVHGLSRTYDLARGTGFLAVKARPSASSPMVRQLFNGDTVEITDRRGSWYFVGGDGFEGWAHRNWMSNSCG
ncbi:SH3 domain-containing protein [Aminobacter anthyllidis]|uniref:SH3 domain-containing protein n=1 Tax=Aminobacter anthyllidis TaxID=1035067 RepID=A0A9X1A6B5_9HYPH|nr:SH3 domain-containing protein [Aminobacter anthyllidis]MBT1154206.1 SH3 domain-containing protein [Aminobacter anthyllidis]